MAKLALETIIVSGTLAYIYLWLSFGGLGNPPSWCCFSSMLTDLSKTLPLIAGWDSDKLHNPIQITVSEPIYEDKLELFVTARLMAIEVLTTALGRGDAFIDDIIKVFMWFPDVIKRHTA